MPLPPPTTSETRQKGRGLARAVREGEGELARAVGEGERELANAKGGSSKRAILKREPASIVPP